MGSADQMWPNGPDNNRLEGCIKRIDGVEGRKQHIYKHKEVGDAILCQREGLSEDVESQNNEIIEDQNKKERGDIPRLEQQGGLQAAEQQQHRQPPGLIVRWERFLPVKSLKILLAESDDSTRQLVSALLRNCSYEVTAVADVLQAWKILDLTNHIDLVLTEVFMPSLCGISLLNKIMNHKTCKNIPVIMMSSNNSMGTVVKCLSKGAVDFLVKPIRKNELKNLWQHIWRRCHSSCGSGSASGIQTQKSVKSKGAAEDSADNSGSNDLNARDGIENGSGTESSCTKRAVEVEGPRVISVPDQSDPPDSTCAQVIHQNSETFCNDWVPPMAANGERQQKDPTDELMGKDLEIGIPMNAEVHYEEYPAKKASLKLTDINVDKLPESDQKNEGDLGLVSNKTSSEEERSTQAAYLIGAIANSSHTQQLNGPDQTPNCFSKIPKCQEKTTEASTDLPSLELSLKRLRSIGECAAQNDRNVVRRSGRSAFSRYHKSATSNQAPTGYGGSCSPLDNSSSEAVRTDSTNNNDIGSTTKNPSTNNKMANTGAALKQGSDGSSNNNDMGSTTKNVFAKLAPIRENTAKSAFCPVQHHHYHHHHLHVHNMLQQQQQPLDRDGNRGASAPQPWPSNVFVRPVKGNAASSGRNHGINGKVNNSTVAQLVLIDRQSANDVAEQSRPSGGGDGRGSGSGSGVDQVRFAKREAALRKFREKRKERNFGKKVRYLSRKRLAEQRPRVRGQFARQSIGDQDGQK